MLRLSLNRVHNIPTKHEMIFIFGSIIAIILLGLGWASMQPSTTTSALTTSAPPYTVSSRVTLSEPPQVVSVTVGDDNLKDVIEALYVCVDEVGATADVLSLIGDSIVPGFSGHCADIISLKVRGNTVIVHYKLLDSFTEVHGEREVCEVAHRHVIDLWIFANSTLTRQTIHDHRDDLIMGRIPGVNLYGKVFAGKSRSLENIKISNTGVHFTFDGEDKHFPI